MFWYCEAKTPREIINISFHCGEFYFVLSVAEDMWQNLTNRGVLVITGAVLPHAGAYTAIKRWYRIM
ncbi:MAG: hypothetical protein A3F31_01500 [Candidatus Levybacteria bacterium RIFCSPHIGHO2_12_FULL_38_12]|nr:MAG: hypothetical protein A3F31_01500 [Candidatus Levybacteria bacterium RIFCSPHIGHO2_12_FULL_38_12]OGH34997.1 MAG: hypothetical protein A3A47_03145 [Candidatus Levybacteria bacterium RIFCSPLOWO2_01_FULL_37_20]